MRKAKQILPLAIITLFPSTAFANAGTALMMTTALHLLIGNALIGLVEGLLLAWIFKCSKWKSVLILIAANYASAWIGGILAVGSLTTIPDITIESIRCWFAVFVIVAFLITLLIEYPFFWFALRLKANPLMQAAKATLLIHGISYALLAGWYWSVSGTSMMTQLDVVSPDQFQMENHYSLYFVPPEGDRIIKSDMDGTKRTVLRKISAPHRNDRLFARPNAGKGYDLYIFLDPEQQKDDREELISKNFSSHAPVEWNIAEDTSENAQGTWFNVGPVPSLASRSNWKMYTGFWPIGGIYGTTRTEEVSFHFSLETPFASWVVRNATQLEGDFVVFQLGDDQICILDPESKKIALIARGKGPVVAE